MSAVDSSSWLKLTEDLDAFQRFSLSRGAGRVFAVISWGCAATKWASRVLNSHRDTFCLHQGNAHLQRFGYPTEEKLDGVAYLRLVASMGSGYSVAGDVHGLSRHHVPTLREAFGDCFRCAVLVRDPLPRVRSQMALYDDFKALSVWDSVWGLDYIADLAQAHGLTFPSQELRPRMFVHAANMLNAILEEREVGPIFRAGDITSDPEALAQFITTLTAGTISLDRDWLCRAVGQPGINRHNEGGGSEWTAWEMDVLRKIVRPAAWDAYAELGYPRPSFLDPS